MPLFLLTLWGWLKSAWGWTKRNWQWIILPVGILIFLFGRASKPSRKIEVVSSKLHGADVKKEDIRKELEEKLGELDEEKAEKIEEVVKGHKETIEGLTDDQKDEADDLLGDPDALNDYLLDVGRSVRDG